jgi:hypothetical protein
MANPNAVLAGKTPTATDVKLGGKAAKEFKFSVNGVNRVKVVVQAGPQPVAKALLATTPKGITGFTPIRQVINLGFVNADKSPVTSFSPAFNLRIRYTKDDLAMVGEPGQLKLAYYAGGKWTVLACTPEPDNPDDAYSEGFLLVSRAAWPADPPVALGN